MEYLKTSQNLESTGDALDEGDQKGPHGEPKRGESGGTTDPFLVGGWWILTGNAVPKVGLEDPTRKNTLKTCTWPSQFS